MSKISEDYKRSALPYQLREVEAPDWRKREFGSWRNYVPKSVQEEWEELSQETKMAVFLCCNQAAEDFLSGVSL